MDSIDLFSGATPLLMCIASCSSNAHKVARLLIDAGADTISAIRVRHVPGANDTPLALTNRALQARNVNGKPATEEQMLKLGAIRRLLLQVPAARAVSWLWPRATPVLSPAAEEGARVVGAVSAPLI